MHKFDYSFLRNTNLPIEMMNVVAGVYSINATEELRRNRYSEVYNKLEKVALLQSVKSSNEIEGIISTDERIKSIVEGNTDPLNHNEKEIAGYKDALKMIHENHDDISFDETNIKKLHEIMLSKTGSLFKGEYKKEDNIIAEVSSDGTRRVRFRPVPARETGTAMEQLVLAYMDARSDSKINQLLLIPCVILDFLCIHPFMDGNGRVSRLLTILLLYKNGLDIVKYISFEEQIIKNKADYYESLRESSVNWDESRNNYMPFIENFLNTLYECYREINGRFLIINGKKATKTQRIEETVLNSLTPLSKAEICTLLPDVSPSTVELVLGKMVKSGKIKKKGMFKNARYIRS